GGRPGRAPPRPQRRVMFGGYFRFGPTPPPRRSPSLRHRPRFVRSARLAQEAEGASGRVIYFRPNKSGSLAIFGAIRRASSLVSSLTGCTPGRGLESLSRRRLHLTQSNAVQ